MTIIRYKLATRNRATYKGFKLPADGEWFYAADRDAVPEACTPSALHHYADPLLAVLFNPIHANIKNPLLFEIEIDDEIDTDGLKGWCRAQRIIKQIPLPEITIEQRIAFAIYYAETFCVIPAWLEWAEKWMNGADRSASAANAAARAAARAAYAAARAADAAAYAADAAANSAAYTAAYAARATYAARNPPDFLAIIKRVIST